MISNIAIVADCFSYKYDASLPHDFLRFPFDFHSKLLICLVKNIYLYKATHISKNKIYLLCLHAVLR